MTSYSIIRRPCYFLARKPWNLPTHTWPWFVRPPRVFSTTSGSAPLPSSRFARLASPWTSNCALLLLLLPTDRCRTAARRVGFSSSSGTCLAGSQAGLTPPFGYWAEVAAGSAGSDAPLVPASGSEQTWTAISPGPWPLCSAHTVSLLSFSCVGLGCENQTSGKTLRTSF